MEITVHVMLCFMVLISGKIRNGICFSYQEGHSISRRQTDLLSGGSGEHIRTSRTTKQPQCLKNEYGPNCTYCVPQNTCEEGHFKCDVSTGSKICLPGYQGQNCRISTKLASSYYDVTCPENTCRNGGSCASGHCCCRDGFTGILCEIEIIECKNNSCLNGGICKDLIGKFECLCKPTFRGKNCEIPVASHVQTTPSRDSGCHSNSCRNNGTCLEDTFLTYCLCPAYYTGDHCETHVGTSSNLPNTCPENYYGIGCGKFCKPQDDCSGHLICDASGVKICMRGWHGKNCDTRYLPQRIDPECPKHGCKNDGQCFSGRCCCRYNYTGDNCQIESIGCLSSPCRNNATCTNKGNGFTCHCLPNFTGKTCDDHIISITTVIPIATSRYIQSNLQTNTYSTTALNINQVSTSFTDHIPSKYVLHSSFTSRPMSPNVIHVSHELTSVLSFTAKQTSQSSHSSFIYSVMANSLSNNLTWSSESHISGTESHISPMLTVTTLPTSSLYFDASSTIISYFSAPNTKVSDSHSLSKYSEISSTQSGIPTPNAGLTTKLSEFPGAISSTSSFVSFSNSFDISSSKYSPTLSSTSANIQATSSHSGHLGAMSMHVDWHTIHKLSTKFPGVHSSTVLSSPTVKDSSHSSVLTLSSSEPFSVSLPFATTSTQISINSFKTSVLGISSDKQIKSSTFSTSTAVNYVSSDINFENSHPSTPTISRPPSETASIQESSLSQSLPLQVSSIKKNTNHLTSDIDNSNINYVSQGITSSKFLGTFKLTTTPIYTNTFAPHPSLLLSSTDPLTNIDIFPTSAATYTSFDQTTSKLTESMKASTIVLDGSNTLSTNEFSSSHFASSPSRSKMDMLQTSKQDTPSRYSSYNTLSVTTDTPIITGATSESVMKSHNYMTQLENSSYISPTGTLNTFTASNTLDIDVQFTFSDSSIVDGMYSVGSSSIIHSTTSFKSAPALATSITTKIIGNGATTDSSILSSRASSTIGKSHSSIISPTKTTSAINTSAHTYTPFKMSPSFYEVTAVTLAPTSSRHSRNIIQSTTLEHVSATMLMTDLNVDNNSEDGISKSWRIALIVVGCVLFMVAVIFLVVFLSVRQRRKDSRIIRQSPMDIQDYSKEHFSEQPDIHNNPIYEVENDSDDDSIKYDIYVVNE